MLKNGKGSFCAAAVEFRGFTLPRFRPLAIVGALANRGWGAVQLWVEVLPLCIVKLLILLQLFRSYLELVMRFDCHNEWKKIASIINLKG